MDKVTMVVPKLLIAASLLWFAWYLLSSKAREANRYFGRIQSTKDLADRYRMIRQGLITPTQKEYFILSLSEYNLEREIYELFRDQGFKEIGETQFNSYRSRLTFRRVQLSHPLEEEVVYFNDNQSVRTPSESVGEGLSVTY